MGQFDVDGWFGDICIVGDYAYVGDQNSNGGFIIIDISDPINPIKVGRFEHDDETLKICVSGSYAYILGYYSGLKIIDISNHSNLLEVGHWDDGEWAYSIYKSGNYIYMANRNGLVVIDVSDPTNPIEIGIFDDCQYIGGVYVSERYAFAYNWEYLFIIDISTPTNPFEIMRYYKDDTCGQDTSDIYVLDSYIYTVSLWKGLDIYCFINDDIEHTITITTPDGSLSWKNGSSHYIYWDFTGYIPLVDIELYKEGIFEMMIASDVSRTPFFWVIPSDLVNSSYYQIKIIDAFDSSVYDVSEYFEISNIGEEKEKPFNLIIYISWGLIGFVIFSIIFVKIKKKVVKKKYDKGI